MPGDKLFHFLRLPIEIRYMIYEIVLCKENKLVAVARDAKSKDIAAILRTSKSVYDEAVTYWRMNTFHLSSLYVKGREWEMLTVNVRHLQVYLGGTYTADAQVVSALKKFENLEKIVVEYGTRVINGWARNRPQSTYQVAKATRFRQLTGHDVLCALRGLKDVKLSGTFNDNWKTLWRFNQDELAVYEEFLRDLVTRPKPTRADIKAKEAAQIKKLAELAGSKQAKDAHNRGLNKRGKKVKSKATLARDEDEYDGSWD